MLRNRRAPLGFLVTILTAVLALVGCGSSTSPSQPQSKVLRPVSVILDWYPNAVHSFLYVAQKEGFFAQEGLQVEFKMPASDPTDGIKLVGAGQETLALYYQPDVVVARQNGIPIVSVAAVVRHPLNHPMAPKGSGIQSPRDLAGKTVGFPGIPMNEGLVRTMVKADGGDPNAVKFANVGFDLVPAIATKKVQAIAGGYINHELILLEKEGISMVDFDPTKYGVPDYAELVVIAGENTAKQDRGLIEAFWRAAAKGFAQVKADPTAGLKVLLEHEAKEFKLEADVETRSLQILLPLMDDGGKAAFGSQDRASWAQTGRWLQEIGLVKSAPDVDAAFINVLK